MKKLKLINDCPDVVFNLLVTIVERYIWERFIKNKEENDIFVLLNPDDLTVLKTYFDEWNDLND